ncbi:MAG: Coenzyme F420 hydrogenase/dehydrogenase, beta subunit C-terminal domain [Candidatus Krumholzibacteria bacterium]|nr:Coenzyme F420 hydrogenase/dehydrogenase, beta subunit C-terminal domain [Candidatus Krumholzibacteria bacterium]
MSRIDLQKASSKGLKELLGHLLGSGKVSAVFSLRKDPETGSYDLGLITEEAGLETVKPLAPVMIANAGQVLSSFAPSAEPIAVVLKPCELRAFIERAKREQGSLENILTISMTCGGVLTLDRVVSGLDSDKIGDYENHCFAGDIHSETRETCKACEYFVPMNADITVSMVGQKDAGTKCHIYLNTDLAKEMAKGFGPDPVEEDFDNSLVEGLASKRAAEKEKLYGAVMSGKGGLDAVIDTFGKCLGCHGCSRVCPICYCMICDFESRNFDNDMPYFEKELEQKGALRLPPDTMFFHIGRMIHMSFSCVGCGQCSDVCPADIPVASVFKKVGEETAAIFEYVPGRDIEEAIPVMVFKEEEFTEFID